MSNFDIENLSITRENMLYKTVLYVVVTFVRVIVIQL